MSEPEVSPEPILGLCGYMECVRRPDLVFTFKGGDEVAYCRQHAGWIEMRCMRQNSKLHVNKIVAVVRDEDSGGPGLYKNGDVITPWWELAGLTADEAAGLPQLAVGAIARLQNKIAVLEAIAEVAQRIPGSREPWYLNLRAALARLEEIRREEG